MMECVISFVSTFSDKAGKFRDPLSSADCLGVLLENLVRGRALGNVLAGFYLVRIFGGRFAVLLSKTWRGLGMYVGGCPADS